MDNDVIDDQFNDRDAEIIKGILLSLRRKEDGWTWILEMIGTYLVKSAYNLLMNGVDVNLLLFGR